MRSFALLCAVVLTSPALAEEPAAAAQAPASPPAAAAPAAPPPAPPIPATTRIAGLWGFGFFGTLGGVQPAGGFDPAAAAGSLPLVGVRFWSPLALGPIRRVGFELALGLGTNAGSTNLVLNGVERDVVMPTTVGVAVHAGLPLALGGGEHAVIFVAPEFRYATWFRTAEGVVSPLDPQGRGQRIGARVTDVSLRAGVEVFFGFLGVPNLSLEGSLRVTARWLVEENVDALGQGVTSSTFGFTTSVVGPPADVILGSVAARYYF